MVQPLARILAVIAIFSLSLAARATNAAIIGISGATFTTNGNASITGSTLTLTPNTGSQAGSGWANTPQPIGTFSARFTYLFGPGSNPPADGFAFVLQNSAAGTSALGQSGGALGYTGTGAITPSAAVLFNIYTPNGVGIKYATNGVNPAGPFTSVLPVNLQSGNPIDVAIDYALATQNLDITLRDTVTNQTFATTIAAGNLQTILGNSTALVGFTGGTGGATALQRITNFSFQQPVPEPGSIAIWSCVGLLGLVAGWRASRGKLTRA